MMAAREPLTLRQELVEMAAPTGRVLAGTVALGLGRVEHLFDPAAEPRRCLRLGLPNRFQDRENRRRVDNVDRQFSERRSVFFQRHRPLRAMFLVTPFGLLRRDEFVRALAERRNDALGSFRRSARLQRVAAGRNDRPTFRRHFARAGERHVARRAEPHFPAPSGDLPHEQPRARAGLRNIEIEAAAVGMTAGFCHGSSAARAQLSNFLPHRLPHPVPHHSTRIVADNGERGKTRLPNIAMKTARLRTTANIRGC